MALVKCPECGATISSAAVACPTCGYPMAQQAAKATSPPTQSAEPLLEVRPSWWRYFWYLVFAWLLIPWLIAWIKRRTTLMRVYHDRIVLERGWLSKCVRELFISDIRSIDIDQGFFERMANIGDLTLSTAATADAVEELTGIPNPQGVRDLIVAQRGANS